MLSEIANVPVMIETNEKASFYDPVMNWDYAKKSYDYDALRAANEAPQNNCDGVEGAVHACHVGDLVGAASGLEGGRARGTH